MPKHLISGLILLVISTPTAFAQGIVAVRDGGKLVFENAPATPASVSSPEPDRPMYWSSKQHRLVPVPPPNSNSMKAARAALADVRRLVRQAAAQDPAVRAAMGPLTAGSTSAVTASRSPRAMVKQAVPAPQAAPVALDRLIEEASAQHGVDPNLVRAIIKVESNFNPHAVSRKGAVGLMQLMPTTARSLNVNPYDPRQNLSAGVSHLKSLLENYGGNIELTLAAYNAGAGAVERNKGVPPYAETRSYIKRITALYAQQSATRYLGGSHPIRATRDSNGHMSFSDLD